jgi:hypothetical protein
MIEAKALTRLRKGFSGKLTLPDEAGYEEGRPHRLMQHRPPTQSREVQR